MSFVPRLSAIAATALLVFTSCSNSHDRATLSLNLGSTLQALSLEGVDVTRFSLMVTCVDGDVTAVSGDLGADGAFEADVPRCPQAIVKFTGLTSDRRVALAGSVDAVIRPPSTDVTVPVLRVGTITIVNDTSVATVCAMAVTAAPELDGRFLLEPGAANEQIVPTSGALVTCTPASSCDSVATCTFTGPATTVHEVSVPFAGAVTVNLAASVLPSLVFTIGPPSPSMAGQAFGPFEVTLLDGQGAVMPRSDVTVTLVPESSTLHGGFTGASLRLASGVGQFVGVTFTTAGQLSFHATAVVDGAVIDSASRNVTVLPAVVSQLVLTAPGTHNFVPGQFFDLTVTAQDPFGNADSLYTGTVSLFANPPTTFSYAGLHQFTAADAGVYAFTGTSLTGYGAVDINAVDDFSRQSAPLTLTGVSPGTLDHFDVSPGLTTVAAGQMFDVTVSAVDPAGGLVSSFTNSVDLTTGGSSLASVAVSGGSGVTQYSIYVSGTYQLYASFGGISGVSVPITVTPAAPFSLVFLSLVPSPLRENQQFGFTVEVHDGFDNACDPSGFVFTPVLNSNGNIGQSLSPGAAVKGGYTVNFTGLSVSGPGVGDTITVNASPQLPAGGAVSNPFDVIP